MTCVTDICMDYWCACVNWMHLYLWVGVCVRACVGTCASVSLCPESLTYSIINSLTYWWSWSSIVWMLWRTDIEEWGTLFIDIFKPQYCQMSSLSTIQCKFKWCLSGGSRNTFGLYTCISGSLVLFYLFTWKNPFGSIEFLSFIQLAKIDLVQNLCNTFFQWRYILILQRVIYHRHCI